MFALGNVTPRINCARLAATANDDTAPLFGLSCRKLACPEHERREIDRLLSGHAAGRLRRHRLLDLVDEIGQRSRPPCGEKASASQRRADDPLERLAVAHHALRLVELLPARGLCVRIDAVRDGSRLTSLTG